MVLVLIPSFAKKCNQTAAVVFKRYFALHLPSRPNKKGWDTFGTWDSNRVHFPLSEQDSIRRGIPIPVLKIKDVGIHSDRGRRNYQEDRYTVGELPNLLYLAIFDGHGGYDAAEFCANHFSKYFLHQMSKQSKKDTSREDLDLEVVLTDTLLDLDSSFSKHCSFKNTCPGTTATVALIRGGYELVIGHIGDSVALMCRDGQAKKLTRDHHPSDPEEKARIEAAGGEIHSDNTDTLRVQGRLNMTRSIGDIDLKDFGLTATPDISRRSLRHGKDNFIALLSDGICSALTESEIVNIALGCESPQAAANRIVDQAIYGGCEDNATGNQTFDFNREIVSIFNIAFIRAVLCYCSEICLFVKDKCGSKR